MNVQRLIEELKRAPEGNYLRIDRSPVGLAPQGADSYRGYYEQLAIEVEPARNSTMTVGAFVKLLEEKLGTTMTGYKGGDYTIRPSTKVWISNYGEASGTAVTGVRSMEYGITYITWDNDDE